jgi:hypothetical protein
MTTEAPAKQRSSSAARMRLSRHRRRDGMRCIPFEVHDAEVEALVSHGLLASADRNNRQAIASALGSLIDRIPVTWWSAVVRR